MNQRTLRGKIIYIGDSLGERGREWFTVTVQPDGSRTLRSRCEIDDAEINHTRVLRDVIYTLDGKWRPQDAFVRLNVDGDFMGSAWFRFTETLVECEGFTANEGRFSQRLPVSSWPRSFGPHPVVCDIWHLGGWDWGSGETTQSWQAIMSSPLPNGASGPMIGDSRFSAEYLGEERITVPAGTFDCHHFAFPLSHEPEYSPEHVWYTGYDMTFVKIRWDYSKTSYELVELER